MIKKTCKTCKWTDQRGICQRISFIDSQIASKKIELAMEENDNKQQILVYSIRELLSMRRIVQGSDKAKCWEQSEEIKQFILTENEVLQIEHALEIIKRLKGV